MSDTFNSKAAQAMRKVVQSGKKGALICEAGKAKRLIFFDDGELVGGRSNVREERLGEIMVREQQITASELEKALTYVRSGRKLGQIMVELGFLKGGEIERFVRMQILDIARGILMSKPTRLVFTTRMDVDVVTLWPVSIGDVFMNAVNRLPDIGLYRDNVIIEDFVLEQTSDALTIGSGMDLSDGQAALLDLVDGTNTVGQILEATKVDEEEAVRVLIALHQSGVVALKERKTAEEPPPGPRPAPSDVAPDPFERELVALYNDIQCQNHWQVLGLQRDASTADIESAYKDRFEKFDPEKWEHVPDSDFHEKLALVRSRTKEAYVTLLSQTSSNDYEKLDNHDTQYQEAKETWESVPTEKVATPESWDSPADVEEAARLFKRAQRAMHERDFWTAIELCRKSIELDDDNKPDRYHLLGRALSENPRWRRDAEKNLKIAHKLEPWEPRYLCSLGELYQKEGLSERAERTFEQVRTLDPDFKFPHASTKEPKTSKKSRQAEITPEEQKVG